MTTKTKTTKARKATKTTTHEAFIAAVRRIVATRVTDKALRARLLAAKLVYGSGPTGTRGVCFFGAWSASEEHRHDFLEVSAMGESSTVQLAGTTIHELGHCLAGFGHGHGKGWKEACAALGLTVTSAGGQEYAPEHFDAKVWARIAKLPEPGDGTPSFHSRGAGAPPLPIRLPKGPRPCPMGIGTRGGTSRGKGSGSRLRLWECSCPDGSKGKKARVCADEWDVTCNRCGERFQLVTK